MSERQNTAGFSKCFFNNISVRTPANSVFRLLSSVRIVRTPSNVLFVQKTFMQGPRKSLKSSASFEEIFFPQGQASQSTSNTRVRDTLWIFRWEGLYVQLFLWGVVKNMWYWGTPYFPNLNPCGDFITHMRKLIFGLTTNCDKILLATVCSVNVGKWRTFVSNFLFWLQVVYATGCVLQMMLPDCQSSNTNERTNTKYSRSYYSVT